jgi:hypothetical protein
VQAAAEATAAAALSAHTGDTSDAHDASAISILDTAADFTATDVEGALAELQSDAEADATALSDHLSDATAAHAASAISADSTTLVGVGTDVQAVLEELDNAIADHLADTADAHAGTAITNTPAGAIAATTVQAAINELDSEKAAASHTHAESDVTNLTTDLAAKIPNTVADANSVLYAVTDDTPAALAMGASTILARLAAGNIVAATPAELRTLLALVVGTNVQAYDADLTTWAGLTPSAYFQTLVDDADAATARATLGASSQAFAIAMAAAL